MSIIELVRDIWMNNACVKFEERSLRFKSFKSYRADNEIVTRRRGRRGGGAAGAAGAAGRRGGGGGGGGGRRGRRGRRGQRGGSGGSGGSGGGPRGGCVADENIIFPKTYVSREYNDHGSGVLCFG